MAGWRQAIGCVRCHSHGGSAFRQPQSGKPFVGSSEKGLVVSAPRRGAIVSALTKTQIISLYEIREVLECRAVLRAAQFGTDFSRVESFLDAAQAVVHDSDQLQFNRLDIQFHSALSDLSGNSELAELAERVHRQIQAVRIRCSVYLPGRPGISHADHLNILDVVRARDSDRAESLIRAHIVSVRDAWWRYFKSVQLKRAVAHERISGAEDDCFDSSYPPHPLSRAKYRSRD